MTITIDKDVPIPTDGKRGGNMYPFDTLEVGDSFFAAGKKSTSLSGCIANLHKKYPDKRLTRRTVVENGIKGVRIWRIK